MKNKKGITLISLVVMIIITLILVSAGTTTGLNVIKESKYSRAVGEMKIIQAKINEMYEEYKNGELNIDNIGTPIDNISSDLRTKAETAITAVYGNLNNIGDFKYFSANTIKNTLDIDGVEEDYLINIKTREVILINGTKNDGEMYYSLSQIETEQFNVEYVNPSITYSPDGGRFILPKSITDANNLNMQIELSLQDIPSNMSSQDLTISYAWSTSKETEPTDSEWTTLKNSTTITEDGDSDNSNSKITQEGEYYLWTRVSYENKILNTAVSKKYTVKKEYDVNVRVAFDATGGEVDKTNKIVINKEQYGELPTPTKAGYVFKGWYTDETEGTKIEINNDLQLPEENLPPTEPQTQTLYARWEETSLMATSETTETEVFLGTAITRDKIKKISFSNILDGHTVNNTNCWDVSDKQNGGVRLWVANTDENGNFEVVIGQDGGVYANASSAYLFSYIGNTINAIIDLENLNTSRITTMRAMFYNCRSLATLDVSKFNKSKVTTMRTMLYNCNNLTTLDVSHFNTSQVTSMRAMFYGCNNLETLDVSHFNTSQVTSMRYMFYNCNNLTALDTSGFDTSKVTSMFAMFDKCANLRTIDVSHFNTSQVTDMKYMFYGCGKISELDLSSFDTSNVTSMLMIFWGDNLLQTIYVSEKWNTQSVVNTVETDPDISSVQQEKQLMFYGCTQLVGGSGTTYNASNENDLQYAHIDEGETNPGYLTYKQAPAPTSTNNSTSTTSSIGGTQSTSLSGLQAVAKSKKATTFVAGILIVILSGIIMLRIKKLKKK